jgi:hypothetical protein
MKMKGILLRKDGRLYRFLKFDFQDQSDGSFYLVFDRKPRDENMFVWSSTSCLPVEVETGLEKFKISYHTTGRVNFHGHSGAPIFCEPIFAITSEQPLCVISIPSVEKLLTKDIVEASDFVLDVGPEAEGRISFSIRIAPNLFVPKDSGIAIEYASWFKILIGIVPLLSSIPEGFDDHFVSIATQAGPYASQVLSVANATIAFHQKAQGTVGQVAYFEPNEGVYRLIFTVEKRGVPKVTIQFVDSSIQAEIVAVSTYQLKFRAKGPAGYVKRETLPIHGIALDSRL